MNTIVAIGRAERYSPNSVEKDAAIMRSVCMEMERKGFEVSMIGEDVFAAGKGGEREGNFEAKLYLTMGRHEVTLRMLRSLEDKGYDVLNATDAIELCCHRDRLNQRLREAGVTLAPEQGDHGYWLKRADGVAEGPGDVVFAADGQELERQKEAMRSRGVTRMEVSAHIEGDLVKFYGVRGSGFFFTCYPGDDHDWKFADEQRNGKPHHYPYQQSELHRMAEKAADAVGIDIYGGDCIIDQEGQFYIIDFNDWPSFGRCRKEATEAIVALVDKRMTHAN